MHPDDDITLDDESVYGAAIVCAALIGVFAGGCIGWTFGLLLGVAL